MGQDSVSYTELQGKQLKRMDLGIETGNNVVQSGGQNL